MDPLIGRLDLWLRTNRPQYHASLRPGATASSIDALERRVGTVLPPLFREMLAWRDGTSGDNFLDKEDLAFEGSWMSIADITETIEMLDGMAAVDEWDYDDWHDDKERPIVHRSFDAWLQTFVEALEEAILTTDDRYVCALDDDAYGAFVTARNPGYPITAEARRRRRTQPRSEPA